MPSDTTGPSGRDEPRRPVILDLPAEDVGRNRGGDVDASAAQDHADTAATDERESTTASDRQPSSVREASVLGGQGPASSEPADLSGNSTEAEDSPKVAQAMPAPARRRTSFGALFTAALLGGGIAGGGLYALDRFGILPLGELESAVDVPAEVARLEAQIAEVRQAGAAPGSEPVDIAPMQEQIAALEQGIAELRQQPSGGAEDGTALQGVQNRVTQLEEATAALRSAPPGGGPDPALEARVTDLSGQVEALRAAPGGAEMEPQITQLGQRIDELAGRLGSLEGLTTRVDDVTGRLEALEARPPVDLSGLEAGVAELRGQQEQLSGQLEASPKEERIAALEAGLTETSRKTELAAALGPAVAADALGSALGSGAPFAPELDALRTLGVDETALTALEPYAASGLPTLLELRSSFETRIAEADLSVPVPEGAGTLGRLVQSARSLVDVRPADPAPGGEPAAVVARIRAALDAGDLGTALAEWSALPERVKSSMAHWARVVEARAAAEDVVARLRSEALSRLGDQG